MERNSFAEFPSVSFDSMQVASSFGAYRGHALVHKPHIQPGE